MNSQSSFPWHYFLSAVKSRVLLILITLLFAKLIIIDINENIFANLILPLIALFLLIMLQAYLRVKPFHKALKQISHIKSQLSFQKKLDLFYKKNEWDLLNEILLLTEENLLIQKENLLLEKHHAHILLESILDPIFTFDNFLNCIQKNSSFQKSFLLNQNINPKEQKLWNIFKENELIQKFKKVVEDNKIQTLNNLIINNRYYNFTITPVYTHTNNSNQYLCICHDITELVLINKLRVDFVANISHEVRTPLTSIKGFSQLLQNAKKSTDSDIELPLSRIIYNCEKLEDMFNRLLKLSIIESQFSITKIMFSFDKLIKLVKSNLATKYPQKEIKIELDSEFEIFGDELLFDQLLTNLIDNSIKYNSNKDIIIKIEHELSLDFIKIIITDNGPGIDKDQLGRIFERFYRVNKPAYEGIEGSGLGLSIVKHIINKHNGQINVESELGQGSRFIIQLPLK